jgi:hypothetical protein
VPRRAAPNFVIDQASSEHLHSELDAATKTSTGVGFGRCAQAPNVAAAAAQSPRDDP